MASKRDYYDILGVSRQSSKDEIKKAYRKLAMQHHPDRNAGDKQAEHKFKELNEAYEVLKDEKKRQAYDTFGHAASEGHGGFHGGGHGPRGGFHSGFGMGGFSDLFEEMFGDFAGTAQQRHAHVQKGSDLRYDMSISLEEAYAGFQKTIKVRTQTVCEVCHGSGAQKSSGPTTCPTCRGVGMIRSQQGFFTIERTCNTCHGTGHIIKDPCKNCYGQGRVLKDRSLKVTIPAGIEDGSRVRLSGEGEAGLNGAPSGDLYVFVEVHSHRLFKRQGSDLYFNATIPMSTAILGGEVEVPTIDGGRSRVSIPAGSQSGKQFRLKGKGMSILRRHDHGDMYIQVEVETPVNLTNQQRKLIEEFAKLSEKANNSPHSSNFTHKLKEFWDTIMNKK
jgi:molecular chaperone DnaJ